MITWAQMDPDNESAFWTTIYPKLLPHTLNGTLTIDPLRRKD